MNISNITPPQVWTSSSRSLTNFGAGALTSAQTSNTAIAAAASVDLRPSPGIFSHITTAVKSGGAATAGLTIVLYDGAQNYNCAATAAAANAMAGFTAISNNTVGLRINNLDGAVAAAYLSTAMLYTQ